MGKQLIDCDLNFKLQSKMSTSLNEDNAQQTIVQAVMVEQIRMLIAQSLTSVVMNFLLASFVAMVFSDMVPGRVVTYWWCCISGFFFMQYLLYMAYQRQQYKQDNYRFWYRAILATAAVGGLAWSIGLTYMLSTIPGQYHIFLIILLISLAAAGITLAIRTSVYLTFQISVLLPTILWLLLQEEAIKLILGVFLLIFMVAMWLFAQQVNRALYNSFRLQLENQSLADSLKQSNARLQVLNEELIQLSATDSLTQVANRRYFDGRLDSEFSRASREHTVLSLIMIDVDFFKTYNDMFGHVAGDECLKKIALAIRDSLKRPTDLVARYGGEEFVVLLPSTPLQGATQLAVEILANIEALKIPHPGSEVSEYVTASAGVTGAHPSKHIKQQHLLEVADEALYTAKSNGRNRMQYQIIEPNKEVTSG